MNTLPTFLYNQLLNQYGEEITNKIIDGYTQNRYTTIRINTLKTSVSKVKETLLNLGYEIDEVPWYEKALIIKNKCENDIKKLDIYEDGQIYLQSLSSMLPVMILNPKESESILDMAAAPGSKTTQIGIETNDKALITACEKDKIRFERLKYNVQKQGINHITFLNEDASGLDDFYSFDKILLDTPCTGSGTINLNGIVRFTEEYLKKLVSIQEKLLKKAIKLLEPNSEMIYSTCSILKEENENNLMKILNENIEIVPIDEKLFQGVPLLPTSIKGTISVMPNAVYEGFFIAKLRKK